MWKAALKRKCNAGFSTIISSFAESPYIVKVVSEKNILYKKLTVLKVKFFINKNCQSNSNLYKLKNMNIPNCT